MKKHADVAVIGLGTMGSAATWQLAKTDLSVLGFEQFGIGHDRSAYGGGSRRFRIVSPFLKETPFTYASYPLFRELEQETGQQLLSRSGALTIGHPDSEHMKNVISTADQLDIEYNIFKKNEARNQYPQHKLLSEEVIFREKTGGVLRAEQIVISAIEQAKSLGAQVYSYTPVQKIESHSNGVTIFTENDTFNVNKVVITTGAWANKLIPSLNDSFRAQRLILSWFMPRSPELFKEDKFPNFTRLSDGIHIQGTPALDGRFVRITNSSKNISEARSVVDDPDKFNKNISVDYAKSIGEGITQLIPNLYPDPVQILPFIDGYSKDGLPIVGSLKDDENVILVCGFSGQGFSQAPIMGEIASHLVLKNQTTHDIEHLSPNKFDL